MLRLTREHSVCVEKDPFAPAADRWVVNPKAKSLACSSELLRTKSEAFMALGGELNSEALTVQINREHFKFLLDLDQADRFGFEIHSEKGVTGPNGPNAERGAVVGVVVFG
jgi:hypothetical protein